MSAHAQSVIATVHVGAGPFDVAVNPATNKFYVANGDETATIVDGSTYSTASVATGIDSEAVAVNSLTNKIYVMNVCGNVPYCLAAGTITVIDGATNDTSSVYVGDWPTALAVNPFTNKIYVANSFDSSVTVIDGVTNDTVTFVVGFFPVAIAVNPATNMIYSANCGSACADDSSASTVHLAGNKIYTAHPADDQDGTVTVINGATNRTTPLNVPAPVSLAINSLTNKIYVSSQTANAVAVIDGATNNITTVGVGNHPGPIALNAVTNKIYVGNLSDSTVTVIDGVSGGTTTVPVSGISPDNDAIVVDTATNKIYVASGSEPGFVTMIDGVTNSTTAIAVGDQPGALAVNEATNRIYATNDFGNTVSVIAGATSATPSQYTPVSPCRLVDTRETHNPIQARTSQDFPVAGACNIPATAVAYALNVTVVPQSSLGYLTVWPAGEKQPSVSTMNSPDGRTKANAAIIPAGYQGSVSVFATDTTDVVLDIAGYFTAPDSSTSGFHPLTPCRVIDTREPNGPRNGPYLQANQTRDFPVDNSPCLQGFNATAFSFNFTVVPHPAGHPLNYLTVWPTGESQPATSLINNPTGTVVANAAIVQSGQGGRISVFTTDDTDLVVDINGFFAPPNTGGLSLYPTAPCRVLDTRQAGTGQPFRGTLEPWIDVIDSECSPPSNAQGYVLNATVVPSGSLGYLTLWPDGTGRPRVSTLNADDGFVTSNMAVVLTNNGFIDAYADGLTQLILDISGYFAP
jgi:YVTN family beta-propeller protein